MATNFPFRPSPRFFATKGKVRLHADWEAELVDEVAKFFHKIAPDAEKHAKRIVPKDTLALRDSIKAGVSRRGKHVVVLELSASEPYADFVEYGTGRAGAATWNRNFSGGGSGSELPKPAGYKHGGSDGYPARPYLRPALALVAKQHFKYGG